MRISDKKLRMIIREEKAKLLKEAGPIPGIRNTRPELLPDDLMALQEELVMMLEEFEGVYGGFEEAILAAGRDDLHRAYQSAREEFAGLVDMLSDTQRRA